MVQKGERGRSRKWAVRRKWTVHSEVDGPSKSRRSPILNDLWGNRAVRGVKGDRANSANTVRWSLHPRRSYQYRKVFGENPYRNCWYGFGTVFYFQYQFGTVLRFRDVKPFQVPNHVGTGTEKDIPERDPKPFS